MLTKKQNQLLRYIHEKLKVSGVCPSYDEMRQELKMQSKAGIYKLILGLEERGFVKRLPRKARSVEVTRLPESIVARLSDHNSSNYDKSSKTRQSNSEANQSDDNSGMVETEMSIPIPVMGKIAAGVPVEAIQNQSHTISVPADFLAKGEHFALEVRGDSMMDAGILSGDTVLIRKENSALNGDIIVALVDNEEATLKRFRKKGSAVALEAANKDYETRTYRPDSISVQGKLVGLFRRY